VLRPDLEPEQSGEEEGPPEVVDELADLLGLHGDEVLVAALLAVLLLEDDCGDTPGLALLGGQVPPRGGARHGKDHLVVLGVRARVVEEVVVRRGEGVRLVEVRRGDGRLGDGGEVAAEGGGGSRFGGVAGGAWLGGVGF
jgi:hypothetical protein